jgi:hypothetical protein
MSTCLVLAVLELLVHGRRRHCPMLLDASLALGHPTTLTFEGVVEPLHLLGAANVLGKCFSYVETQNQSKCYLGLQVMDPIPQHVRQHRRIPEAPLLRRIIVQVRTINPRS